MVLLLPSSVFSWYLWEDVEEKLSLLVSMLLTEKVVEKFLNQIKVLDQENSAPFAEDNNNTFELYTFS